MGAVWGELMREESKRDRHGRRPRSPTHRFLRLDEFVDVQSTWLALSVPHFRKLPPADIFRSGAQKTVRSKSKQ